MAVIRSIVNLSQLEGAKRLDAEYYQPEYLMLDKILHKVNYVPLGRLCQKIHRNPMCYGFEYVLSGIQFLRIDDLNNPFIDTTNVVFISEDTHKKFFSTALKYNDILMGVRGNTIGRVGIYKGEDYKSNISPNLIFFRLNDNNLSNYVAIILLSNLGKKQIERILAGTGQPTITSDLIKKIKIPFIRDMISKIIPDVEEAFKKFDISRSCYFKAENLLLQELGLMDFQLESKLTYSASLSRAFSVHRLDAEYFRPAYEKILSVIADYNGGYLKLLECIENIPPHWDPRKYPEQTFKYVELADIETSTGTIQSASEIIGKEAPRRARRILQEGDVIVPRVEGSLQKVALVDSDYNLALASTGFFQWRPVSIQSEVLLVLAKSFVLQMQLKKECAGTILSAVPKESVRKLIIPNLPKNLKSQIADLVIQSHQARKGAKQLLEEAKKKLEEAIESRP